MKIALAQMSMSADSQENLQKSLQLLKTAAEHGADLIFYPEVQLTPFFAQQPKSVCAAPAALKADDPAQAAFCRACREQHIMASPNFYYQENGKPYDTSFLIDRQGKLLGTQKMVHIAQAEQFYEQDYYTPAPDGFHVFDTPEGKIGIVVCFDRHYPESVRTEALRGAQLILIPTANTAAEPMELFEQEIRVQAFQNCVWLAMCNRVGQEKEMDFAGESLVCDPDGRTVAKADRGETLLYAQIDIRQADQARMKRSYLNLRRPEFYV